MWTRRSVAQLVNSCKDAQSLIRKRLLDAKLVLDADRVAWGQFLDGDRNRRQFGVYGTSAAITSLVLVGVDLGNDDIRKAQESLPFNGTVTAITCHEENDTSSIFKIAAVLDAVDPASDILSNEPEAARRLMTAVLDGCGWGNYWMDSATHDGVLRVEPTAVALLALSRVQSFRGGATCMKVLKWFADEVGPRNESPPEVDALAALVLAKYSTFTEIQGLDDAQERCLSRLRAWRRRNPHDAASHAEYHYEIPVGSAGESKYIFFPVHVLAAYAFLATSASTQADKIWAARIAGEVTDSVRSHHGYRVGANISTVDQLWVIRLLSTCAGVGATTPSKLLQRPLNQLDSARRRGLALFVLLALGALGIALSITKHTVGLHIVGYTLSGICLSGFVAAAWAWWGGGESAHT